MRNLKKKISQPVINVTHFCNTNLNLLFIPEGVSVICPLRQCTLVRVTHSLSSKLRINVDNINKQQKQAQSRLSLANQHITVTLIIKNIKNRYEAHHSLQRQRRQFVEEEMGNNRLVFLEKYIFKIDTFYSQKNCIFEHCNSQSCKPVLENTLQCFKNMRKSRSTCGFRLQRSSDTRLMTLDFFFL